MNASRNITWQYYDVIMRHDGVILRDMSQYYVVSFVDVIHLILLLVACHTPICGSSGGFVHVNTSSRYFAFPAHENSSATASSVEATDEVEECFSVFAEVLWEDNYEGPCSPAVCK